MDECDAPVDPNAHNPVGPAQRDYSEITGHHRVLYFGVHDPSRRRHHHHHHKHHKSSGSRRGSDEKRQKADFFVDESMKGWRSPKRRQKRSEVKEEVPADRVKFVIGGGDDVIGQEMPTVFTELEELSAGKSHEMEWRETARWIKFEEDVEEGGEKWSKPHVATLSLHSLFELRSCMLRGTVLLDLEAKTLEQIAGVVLDHFVNSRQLDAKHRQKVIDTLLLKHRHHGNHRDHHHHHHHHHHHKGGLLQAIKGSFHRHLSDLESHSHSDPPIQPAHGSHPALSPVAEETASLSVSNHNASGSVVTDVAHGGGDGPPSRNASFGHAKDPPLMKKLPPGAEASNVLVGELEFLEHHQLMAFIRLKDAVLLGDLTEVPLPTRFLVILLGPLGSQASNHEVGRSVATLMSDPIFHDVAYKASNREDILAGIDVFLDQVVILPPGEWDPTTRIEPPKKLPTAEERKRSFAHPPMPSALDQKRNRSFDALQCGEGGDGGGAPGNGGGPGGEHDNQGHADQIKRTKRIFGGLIQDVKRKSIYYASDVKDALSLQCIASILFIFFASISPAITFGGVLGGKTDNLEAAFEMILASSLTGMLFALTGGQPLIILGATGPMLVFEEILFTFCKDSDIDYLAFREWIGLWTALLCIILVATDASALVQYITRFTEETFSVLISVIFIYEAISKIFGIGSEYLISINFANPDVYRNCACVTNSTNLTLTNQTTTTTTLIGYLPPMTDEDCEAASGTVSGSHCPKGQREVLFLSIILMSGTFLVALYLKAFQKSRFLPSSVRRIISDFAVVIAVVFWVGMDAAFGVNTPKLVVPSEFSPTEPEKRGFFINPIPSGFPGWAPVAALLPAILLVILVFMDQQITAIITNRKENRLKKGAGYHLDLFIVALLFVLCSVMGLPWVVAATVRSVTHVNSLKVFSKTNAPGESPTFLGIREQRVTAFVVALLIGLSLLLTPVLKIIPMPVLYGIFLFMGVSSLKGVQFVERCLIILMPPKYQPDRYYIRHLPNKRIHLFTTIQFLCLVVLVVIKLTPASIALPVFVLLLVVVRKLMNKIFTEKELAILDDRLPEFIKRKKADEKKKKGAHLPTELNTIVPISSNINISAELNRCNLWRHLDEEHKPRYRKNPGSATEDWGAASPKDEGIKFEATNPSVKESSV